MGQVLETPPPAAALPLRISEPVVLAIALNPRQRSYDVPAAVPFLTALRLEPPDPGATVSADGGPEVSLSHLLRSHYLMAGTTDGAREVEAEFPERRGGFVATGAFWTMRVTASKPGARRLILEGFTVEAPRFPYDCSRSLYL
jgi:hypothetical protein